MPAYPNVAVLGPIVPNPHDQFVFTYSTADIGCIQHKSSGPHSTEQEADLALKQMQAELKDSGHIVYHARSQEDRGSAIAFLRAVTEYVTSEDDKDE